MHSLMKQLLLREILNLPALALFLNVEHLFPSCQACENLLPKYILGTSSAVYSQMLLAVLLRSLFFIFIHCVSPSFASPFSLSPPHFLPSSPYPSAFHLSFPLFSLSSLLLAWF